MWPCGTVTLYGGSTMTAREAKHAAIVTFHRKDRRREQSSDKVELARKMVNDPGDILDVDFHDAPIVVLNATTQEIERLRNDANIAAVEEDCATRMQDEVPTAGVTP